MEISAVSLLLIYVGRRAAGTDFFHLFRCTYASAYGKENAFSKLAANAVNKENAGVSSVLYAQKNTEPILNAEGVQFPNRYAF